MGKKSDARINIIFMISSILFLRSLNFLISVTIHVQYIPVTYFFLFKRLWDFTINRAVETLEHHTEFVYGLDFSLFKPGEMADCSWDEVLRVFTPKSLINPGMTLQHWPQKVLGWKGEDWSCRGGREGNLCLSFRAENCWIKLNLVFFYWEILQWSLNVFVWTSSYLFIHLSISLILLILC